MTIDRGSFIANTIARRSSTNPGSPCLDELGLTGTTGAGRVVDMCADYAEEMRRIDEAVVGKATLDEDDLVLPSSAVGASIGARVARAGETLTTETPMSKPWRDRPIIVALLAMLLGFSGGIAVTMTASEPETDPYETALSELGTSLPIEQHDAILDGAVTFDEVMAAADATRECVADAGVTGYTLTVSKSAWGSTYEGDTPEGSDTVLLCENRHFNATRDVYRMQMLQSLQG